MDLQALVVEDHASMRAALVDFLALSLPRATVLEAESVARTLELLERHRPGIALVDVALPDGNGIDLVGALRAAAPGCAVLVVSQHSAPAYVERALAAGACAYIAKDRVAADLPSALERALAPRAGA